MTIMECTVQKILKHVKTEKGRPAQIQHDDKKRHSTITRYEYKKTAIDNIKIHMESYMQGLDGVITQFKLIYGNKQSKSYPVLNRSCKCPAIDKYCSDTQEDIVRLAVNDISI